MFASVVVLTRNRLKQLERCLQSLRAQSYRDFEVVVVDTGSTDGTPDWLRRDAPVEGLRLIEIEGGSFAGARNQGVEAARGEWVAFLDDDCMAAANWLHCLADVAERCDAVGGLALPAQPMPLPSWWHPEIGWLVGWSVPPQLRRSTGSRFYPSTSNMAVRRALLLRHRFQEIEADFDAADSVYRGGREDAEFWRRLRRLGYRTRFFPEIIVYHDVPLDRFKWRYLCERARADGRALWEREQVEEILDDACRQVAYYYLTWYRRLFGGRPARARDRLWAIRQKALIGAPLVGLPRGERLRTLATVLGRAGRHVAVSELKRMMRPLAVRRERRRYSRQPLPEKPHRLAIVAFGFLGDMVIIEPACRAFHEAHPSTHLVLVTHPTGDLAHEHVEFWERRVVYTPPEGGNPSEEDLERMRNELQGLGIDAAAILYHHDVPPDVTFHTTQAGILTFDQDVGFPRQMWYEAANARMAKKLEQQEILNIATLLQWWGPLAPLRPYRWKVSAEERRDARALLRLDEQPRRHLIALHAGSVLPYKQWPLMHWMALAARLGAVENLDLVFVGDEKCIEGASQIIRANRLDALNLCGRLSVRMLAAVLSEVSLLVTADSGPKHVAFAVGTPTVSLYGHSAPERWGAFWDKGKHVALRGGNADLTPEETAGLPVDYLMSRISPDRVYDTIRVLFEKGKI
jgi:ADP-heptose:LPS heptosyltransferase/GT2 family glycosyltransferase